MKLSKIKRNDYEKQLDQFVNIIGLNYTAHHKMEKITLNVYAKHIKYLESLPLHHSQKIQLDAGAEYGLVTYHLIPNYEFTIEILKMNSMAEVLEPQWLRDKILDMILGMISNYGISIINENRESEFKKI